jgi:hypothetical protein
MAKYLFALSIIVGLITSCNNDQQKNADTKNKVEKTQKMTTSNLRNNIKIRNDINIKAEGIDLSQAFLLYDDGTLVPETNETGVGKPVKMRLIIDGGWKEQDGKVSIGASEKIETSDGGLVLDEKDLFADMPIINADDAKVITLTANISSLDKLYDYFLVSFKVWDKNGTGQITGSYKLS